MVEARSAEKIREIIEMIEHSQLPLVDSKFFSAIRAKIAANQPIDDREYDRLVRLAGKAGKWDAQVESSAKTDPDELYLANQ